MRRDPTEFRQRFNRWKNGLPVYQNGKPVNEEYEDYGIPFVQSKRVKLSNAGLATGAVLSTNMLDSIADNAVRAGLPVNTAIGLSTKESTLGNPTDDRSARTLLSPQNRAAWSGLGYGQRINEYGDYVSQRDLVNMYKDQEDSRYGKRGVSVLQGAFELYRNAPHKYNPGQKNYQQLVNKRANEVMQSPEVQQWVKERAMKQSEEFRKYRNRHYVRTPKFEGGKDDTPIDGGVPFEITVTGRDRRPAWKKMYQNKHLGDTSQYYNGDALRDVVGFVPGISDAVDGVEAADALNRGDYTTAAIGGGMLLMPNILEKPLKLVGKPLLKASANIYNSVANYGRNAINSFIDRRILKNIESVNSAEKVEELFKSRMRYANNNSQYVEPALSTREYNQSVIDDIVSEIRQNNPQATDEQIRDIFIKTTQVTPEDLLNALGFVYRDENGVVRAASYNKGLNPKRTMYTKTHEWNHTGFNFEKQDPNYTWIDTSEGSKNYLNENQGFITNDVSDEDGLYLNADEISSYMSEIKTMLGKRDNQKLTARELDFLNRNRKIINNNLGHSNIYNYIFDRIKDPKKFAKWVNDNATMLTIPIVGGTAYKLNNTYAE